MVTRSHSTAQSNSKSPGMWSEMGGTTPCYLHPGKDFPFGWVLISLDSCDLAKSTDKVPTSKVSTNVKNAVPRAPVSPTSGMDELEALRLRNKLLTEVLSTIKETADAQVQKHLELVWFARNRSTLTCGHEYVRIALTKECYVMLLQPDIPTMRSGNESKMNTKMSSKSSLPPMEITITASTVDVWPPRGCLRNRRMYFTSTNTRM